MVRLPSPPTTTSWFSEATVAMYQTKEDRNAYGLECYIRRNALIELIMLCDAARWQGIEILMTSMAARMSIATLC